MKDSEINELKSELQEKKDEGLASELTSEEKTSKGVDNQFDLSVPTEGEHVTLSFNFCSESLNDERQCSTGCRKHGCLFSNTIAYCIIYCLSL